MSSHVQSADASLTPDQLIADGLMNIAEAEDFSGFRKSKLYELMGEGRLPYVKLDSGRRIPKRGLVELMKRHLVVRDAQ